MSKDNSTVSSSTSLNWQLIEEQRRLFDEAQQEKQELDEILAILYDAYFEDEGGAIRESAGRIPESFRKENEEWAHDLLAALRKPSRPPTFLEQLRNFLKHK